MPDVAFLTPLAGLVALLGVAPLLALLSLERPARRARELLGLPDPPGGAAVPHAAALAAVAVLLGIALAQPVLSRSERQLVRTGVEAIFMLDISRSMLAASEPDGPIRFERARRAALEMRTAIPDVPVGLVSLTDRVLPHLFPTPDAAAFAGTLDKAIGIERPPPRFVAIRATRFEFLKGGLNDYYSEGARRRLLVVFTDGEAEPIGRDDVRYWQRFVPRTHVVFVRFWSSDERVFQPNGRPEPYLPDPTAGPQLELITKAMGWQVFDEDDLDGAIGAVRAATRVGGPARATEQTRARPLGRFVVAAAFLPLGFLLWRRNRP